ncbi:MAG: molecular chaperone HtpG [Pseudomonadota bacterium]
MSQVDANQETLGFQTEVAQLLDLMIHSLYSNKEIFLRELISNASDAADKLRFEALSNADLFESDPDLKIRVAFDQESRTVTGSDNGIGMSREEVINNLGTIAKSGTRQFLQSLTGDQARDSQLIGQFGVGFYSSFIVADRVTVRTRRAGALRSEGVRWESGGEGEYVIETIDRPRRGTEVTLHLREDADEFLDDYRLRTVVRKYSDHISLPIVMTAPPPPARDDDDEEDAPIDVPVDETVNSATALWTRSKSDVSDEEYDEFYKHVAHDFEAPLLKVHSKVEGRLEYTSLLFVPARAPFDLWDRNARRGVKLYVRRVFIMDDAEQLMPPYLRFVRGVIDSNDLPLNISREILQGNRQIDSMRNGSVKKVLNLLESTAKNDAETYQTFWEQFGRVLKEGIVEDASNRETLAGLMRFASTHDPVSQSVSLSDYVARMREGQKHIYYITADTVEAAAASPHLEIFNKHNVEVLYLTDEVDEWLVGHLHEFGGTPLQSVTKGELGLDDLGADASDADTDTATADTDEDATPNALIEQIKACLGEQVKDVRVTKRLVNSPACLVADEHELGAHLERILKASGQEISASKPIMEVNLEHPLVKRMEGQDESALEDWAYLLYGQAVLSEGAQLPDGADFVRRLNRLLDAA